MIDEQLDRIAAFHRSRPTVPEFPMVAEVLDVLDAVRSPEEIPPAPPLTVTRNPPLSVRAVKRRWTPSSRSFSASLTICRGVRPPATLTT
ncbi:MAG: hypothetical protein CL433_09470 [Acidimicrobiaceae bacterium]|nr:hypothetical protein [Acidimicrobiaceae bacterium]HAB58498.1 hypothetical protein [Acidimicrobiaceae bacterium]